MQLVYRLRTSLSVSGNTTTVTVPNCVDGALKMNITCKVTRRGFSYQKFRVMCGPRNYW